jgi:hypothetical protein
MAEPQVHPHGPRRASVISIAGDRRRNHHRPYRRAELEHQPSPVMPAVARHQRQRQRSRRCELDAISAGETAP